jgi:hypothetical protein
MADNETHCCPRFDPEPWQDKKIRWKDKLFAKDSMGQFLHMPLPGAFRRAVARMWKKIQEAGGAPDTKDFVMLAAESSPWKGELYINVTKAIPDAENIRLSGTYITRVFDGPYSAIPKWIKEMDRYVNQEGKTAKKHYFYYTTCPRCAKVYGHNYVVAFAEV